MSEGQGIRGTESKKVKRLAKQYTWTVPGHRQQCGEGQRRGLQGRGEQNGVNCNSVNNKKYMTATMQKNHIY